MPLMKDFVVVTGYTGVVGARLSERLAGQGVPLVLVNSRGIFVHKPGKEAQLVCGDVFDWQILSELMKGAKACVHLAADTRERYRTVWWERC
jgi:nucleoside-diphosphate-sugar epimerase